MPRRLNYETRICCHTYKHFTQFIEPIKLKTEFGSRFHFKAVCAICNKFKTKYLNLEQVKFYLMILKILLMDQLSQILLNVMEFLYRLYL